MKRCSDAKTKSSNKLCRLCLWGLQLPHSNSPRDNAQFVDDEKKLPLCQYRLEQKKIARW
jgi:hypothetical protein